MLNIMAERCWKTAISRFESARRMRRCHNASTLCIAMLSLEIIVINLLIFIKSLELNDVVITITTVCLSMFVLVLSLIVSHLKYEKREEQYHECGLELSNLEKDIKIYLVSDKDISHETLKYYNDQYNSILRKWNLNHSNIDFEWAIYKNGKLHKNAPENINWRRNNLLEVKWHLLRSDSIYNLLTFLGFIAIILIIVYSQSHGVPTEGFKNPSIETQDLHLYKNASISDTISECNCIFLNIQNFNHKCSYSLIRLRSEKNNPQSKG